LYDVGRVTVKDFFKLLSFLHLYLLFYYNYLGILIVRVGMLNGVNFISGLNTTVTIVTVLCLATAIHYKRNRVLGELATNFTAQKCAGPETAI